MKYLKKIFEAVDDNIPDEILDNLLNIYDVYGEPTIKVITFNGVTDYAISWNIGFREIADANLLRKEISNLTKIIDDIDSAKGRFSKKYDFNFILGTTIADRGGIKLLINLKSKAAPMYNFVKNIDIENESIYLNKQQIKSFFEANNIKISKIESDKPFNKESEEDIHSYNANEYLYIEFSDLYVLNTDERYHFENTFDDFEQSFMRQLGKYLKIEIHDCGYNHYGPTNYSWLIIKFIADDEYYKIILK